MGYSNYWKWTNAIADADKFVAWSRDVERLLASLQIPVCGPDGTGHPLITSEMVAFNGDASLGQHYESFVIRFTDLQEPQYFGCCKTGVEPYELLVRCALVRLAHYFPDVQLWSDGEEPAIDQALKLCRDLFGENKQPKLPPPEALER